MDLDDELIDLTSRHTELLDGFPWASERVRWAELVFCLVNAVADDAYVGRETVAALGGAGLIEPDALARAGDPAAEYGVVLRHVLRHQGLDPDAAEGLATLLTQLARSVQEQYGGKVQRLLRAHAETLHAALVDLVPDAGDQRDHLARACAHWLQNVADLPISLVDPPVRSFLEARDLTAQDLEEAADRLDLHIGLLDDVLRAELEERTEAEEEDGSALGAAP